MNLQNSPQIAVATTVVKVTELPCRARFSLRTALDCRVAVSEALGLVLPTRIGERRTSGRRSALCLGPDEWVLHTEEADSSALVAALVDLSARLPLSAVDIGDREIVLAVEGPAARDLLATGCPLDLARMPVGTGTRTVFDTVQVVLTREAEDRFRLEVWRSFAPHVRALLATAAEELAEGL